MSIGANMYYVDILKKSKLKGTLYAVVTSFNVDCILLDMYIVKRGLKLKNNQICKSYLDGLSDSGVTKINKILSQILDGYSIDIVTGALKVVPRSGQDNIQDIIYEIYAVIPREVTKIRPKIFWMVEGT